MGDETVNYLEHEYLVPIFLGSSKANRTAAKLLKKNYGFVSHCFAEKFTLFDKFTFKCHRTSPFKSNFVGDYVFAFARTRTHYELPILIVCDETARKMAERCRNTIEAIVVIVECTDIIKED